MSRENEILQHKILVRLARKAQSAAVAAPAPPAPAAAPTPAPAKPTAKVPAYSQQVPAEGVGEWPHKPAVTQAGVTHGSPIWAHGNANLKTDAENAYDVPNQVTSDSSNVLGTDEGFPRTATGSKAPPVWREEAKARVKNGEKVGDNLYGSILTASLDPNSDFGKIASHSSQVVRNAFLGARHLFSCVRDSMGKFGDRFQNFTYLTHMPVAAMIHNIRTKIAGAGKLGLSDEELAHLEKQYQFYTQEMTGMSERGKELKTESGAPLIDKKEKRLPLLPNEQDVTWPQNGAQPPKPEKEKKKVDPRIAGGKKADEQNTVEAKAINHNAMAFLNKDIFSLYRQMRDETRAGIPKSRKSLEDFYKDPANRKPIEDSIRDQIESGTHPEYDSFLVNGKKGQKVLSEKKINTAISNHITGLIDNEIVTQKSAHKERVKALGAIEHALSTANFSMSTLANMGNSDTRNFADWYDSGSTRTTAALVHYINTNPNWAAARNKFGRIEGYDPNTHQPDPNSRHKRLTFDNHDQIAGLTSLMSMLGPTSANEKPSNNAKIALGLLDEGIHQWNLKNGNNPNAKDGPSALDILAHAPIDKRAYGLISEYKGQKNYKFWSGLFHAAKNDKTINKSTLNNLKDVIESIGSGNSAPDTEHDIGNYFQNPDGSFRLAPIEDFEGGVAYLGVLVASELSEGKFKGNKQAQRMLQELVARHHGSNPVGFEDQVYRPEKVHLRTPDGKILANPMGLSTRPGSAIKSLHLIKAFHRGMTALNSLPDGISPEGRIQAVTNAIHIAPHADDEFSDPKYLLQHLAGTSSGRADMGYPEFEGTGKNKTEVSIEENARRHAQSIAKFLDKYRGQNPDSAYHDFLTGVHKWEDVNAISPADAPNWVEVDQDGNLTHRGISDGDRPGTGGALVQGNKFGNYVTSVYGAATKASKAMMQNIQRYSPYMTVDRVMMEDLMNATGRWLGGVPESEFQRANVHRAAELAALALAEHYGDKEAALHFNKMQAAQWVLIQLANTGLGGNNPTEQLYTGVESADREARINGHRLLKAYAGKKVTPQEAAKLQEWHHFLNNESPLNIAASNGGEAYAMLHDQPYVASTGQYGGDAAHEHAQRVLKEKMAGGAQALFDQMTALGKQKKHFKKEVGGGNNRARPSNSGRVQAVRTGNPAGLSQGAKVVGKKADAVGNLRNGAKHAAPVRSLHGPASRPAQPGSNQGSGRSGSGSGAHAPEARVHRTTGGKAGTGRTPAVVKYSGQFMRAMLLGTSASSKKFSEQMKGIASQIGVPIRTYNGVGDATSASTPAVAHISSQAVDPDRARYLAAWSGLLGNKRSVMVFHPDEKGTDSLYSIRMPITDMQKVRAALDSKGIQHRTVVPGVKHTHVFVYDPRRIMRTSIAAMAEDNNADVLESSGHGEFIGRAANSAGADPLADSREHYRRIIADYEERNGQGNGQDQASPGANGGGSGPPVSGSSAAGRSPSGGTIFRGVTYKGGAFTPAPEQKGPPQKQMGSPQRFSKKKVRLSKETSLATEGMQEAASNPVVKSMSAANDAKQHVRSAYNNSGTHPTNPVLSSSNQANGAIGVSAPIGDTGGMAEPGVRPEDPLPTSIHFAAFKAGKHETHDPIAYSSDINAIRHMLANTAEQRITPHARYAEAMKMGHKVGGSGLKSMCDEMQKTLGMAAHGNQLLTQSLLSDPAEVNHDIPLESGVTRLSGYIAPYSGGNSDFMSSKAYKADPTMPGILNLLRDRNQPFRRDYVPLTPLQYGLMDYLHPSEMNHPPVYGTPDGRLFLNPEHANRHIASNPGIIKFNGRLHNPWHHIMDRVGTYTGVDHIINAIARDSELHKAEGGSDEIMSTLGSGRISDVGVDKFKSLLKAEPKRFTRLLDILSDHLGSSDPSLVASSSGGVTPRNPHPAGFGQAVIRENTPLSWSLGSSNPDKLTETAARIHNLWSNLTDRPNRLHLRVGSYMPNNVKEASDLGFQSAHGYDPTLGDYHDGSFTPVSSEPVSSVNVSQIMTPTVLAHEMAHHAETMIPGVGRAVMEHAFANSGGEPEHAEEYGFGGFKWNTLRTDWTDSPVISKYAKRINPGRLLFTAPWNNGVRRLNNFPGSSEYLSSMTEEFFARPVKMCREHPLVARMVLGLMNGALRNVR